MNEDIKHLLAQGEKLFSKRSQLLSMWQDLAENFYVERADFTVNRTLGDDFASGLTTSYPTMARRDLGNALSAMLRPSGQDWFKMAIKGEPDHEATRWLEAATRAQKRAMYDRLSGFMRACKQGDHDFATFGQCVIQVNLNLDTATLLYRNWHLRDVAWCEDKFGMIGTVYRNWAPEARELEGTFKKLHSNVTRTLAEDPYRVVRCQHIVVPSSAYKGEKTYRTPFVSLYVDVENQFVMEEVGVKSMEYVIPRWQTVSGSQYAYSPATVCALPDSRLLQAMTLTLLEAGEKSVNPPMIGVSEAFRSDLNLFAGGFTAVDAAYDERLGEVLRPLTVDKSGIPNGIEMSRATMEMIQQAFFLNKLSLPIMAGDMTATEVSQRVQEYIRQALPLFEPMEFEYNGTLCERTFEVMMAAGGFGPPDSIPESLSESEIEFKFQSPLQEADGKKKGQTFMEARALLAATVEADPTAVNHVNFTVALRDALSGIGAPAHWMRSEKEAEALTAQQQQAAQQQQLLAMAGQGAAVAEQFGRAGQALAA